PAASACTATRRTRSRSRTRWCGRSPGPGSRCAAPKARSVARRPVIWYYRLVKMLLGRSWVAGAHGALQGHQGSEEGVVLVDEQARFGFGKHRFTWVALLVAAVAAVAALAVAGCGSDSGDTSGAATSADTGSATADTGSASGDPIVIGAVK